MRHIGMRPAILTFFIAICEVTVATPGSEARLLM